MTDRDFLVWLRARLIYVYGELENLDFVRRLQTIVEQMTDTQTPTTYLEHIDRDVSYVAADLADGPWHERLIGRLMRWYWNRLHPRLEALPESEQVDELRRMGLKPFTRIDNE